jgi:hypothetical protein
LRAIGEASAAPLKSWLMKRLQYGAEQFHAIQAKRRTVEIPFPALQ